jgi:DNA-directed RNA polymerase specialized sigma24 family protein
MRPSDEEFTAFLARVEPRVRRALSSSLGAAEGQSATQAAMTWAWENWSRVLGLSSPVGYLYRVGMTAATRGRSRELVVEAPFVASISPEAGVDPEVLAALDALSPQQRAAVLLVHGYGYSLRDAAEVLDLNPSTIRVHAQRGLARLRRALERNHVH